jgi:uncharacterized protein DUF4395
MHRQSEVEFVRQMGFDAIDPDHQFYVALMFQPRTIACLISLGIVLQNAWLFLGLAAALWGATVFPALNPFDAAYDRLIGRPHGLPSIPHALPPRRFAQAMAGSVALIVGASLLTGAFLLAWVFEALFAIAVASVLLGRICSPAILYLRFRRPADRPSSLARRA